MRLNSLIKKIGDENITYQQLSQCMTGFKFLANDCRVTFSTENNNIESDKEAIIIWVDSKVFDAALNDVKSN